MAARHNMFVGLVAVFVLVQGAFAADLDGRKRPSYSPVLRQNEDWSVLAGYDTLQTKSFFDPIKYIPLSDDDNLWMSFGSQSTRKSPNHRI